MCSSGEPDQKSAPPASAPANQTHRCELEAPSEAAPVRIAECERGLALVELSSPCPQEHPLPRLPTILGRERSCGVVLDHPSVAPLHARLVHLEDRLHLTDLGSAQGTRVNRRRVEGTDLRPGDTLRLGDLLLKLVSRPATSRQGEAPPDRRSLLVGGKSLTALRREIAHLAPTTTPVLLSGESGTGKELTAREIHRLSGRKGRFVAARLSGLPAPLVDEQLFGRGGAGATGRTQCLIEAAKGGTLFLDDVHELPLSTRRLLFQALETGAFGRVGSERPVPFGCRLVAATDQEVRKEGGRNDLAFRLRDAEIQLKPLRERSEDLQLLIEHLGWRAGLKLRLSLDALETLACYSWPRNVRELENLVRLVDSVVQADEIEVWDVRGGIYRFARLLNITGEGSVWLGEHGALGPKLAIRVIRGGMPEDGANRCRFAIEAKALGRVDEVAGVKTLYFGKLRASNTA